MADANALKDAGNKAFAAKDYDKAIDLFTQAIDIDPNNHVLYSNRSASKAGKRMWADALEDAEQTIRCNPSWAKGYARKGAALHGAKRWEEAVATYEAGLKLEDTPALRKGLQEVQDARDSDSATGFGKMFSDPNLLAKLAANPKTAPMLADQSFVQQLQLMQKQPALAGNALQDPRMITVLGVLLGIDMQGFSRPEGSDELPEGFTKAEAPATSAPPPPTEPKLSEVPSNSTRAAPPPPADEDEEMEGSDAANRKQAEEQKRIGGEAYRKRDFAAAKTAYMKAWEVWPKDLTYLTNLSAVYFEAEEYDQCIETCEKAVDVGRSMRADYKLIAKAFGRAGTAYAKKGDDASAIKFYQKSLSEHRTPDILNKLKEAEKRKADMEQKAYIDPQISAEEREKGNALFKAGNFADAVKAYSEAIKRHPSDPRGYNNRAAAYTKLVAFPEALKDAETALTMDPTFVKAYIRKSMVLAGMKDYSKAMEAAMAATDADTEHKHTAEITGQIQKINQEMYKERSNETPEQSYERAMRDPEIQAIMSDPVMQSILQQAQGNPAALQDHMKSPMIREKIMKLINAGIIRTG